MTVNDPHRRIVTDVDDALASGIGAANGVGKVASRVDKHSRQMRNPTHPFYDSNNFPEQAAYGQIVVDKDDPSSLWVYGKDDTWHEVGGTTNPPPSPGSMVIPVGTQNKLVRFPGGVVGLRAIYYASPGATQDDAGTYPRFNPTQGLIIRGSGGFSDQVEFSPVDDFGWGDGVRGTIWVGYRVRSGTGQMKALSADYVASGGVLWPGGVVGLNLPTSSNFGYQGMGFGYMGAYGATYHSGVPVTIQTSGDVDIDWILGMPNSGYYFYGGQQIVGTAGSRGDFPQFASDPSMFVGDGYGYDTQKRDSQWQDAFTLSEDSEGWSNNVLNDKNTIYAVYIMARVHKSGWNFSTDDCSQGSLSWYENAGHKATFTLFGNGAWVPAYMGMYHVAQNDYQIAGWIPNDTYFTASVNMGNQPDEVRWQRVIFIPVRKSLSAESVGSKVGGATLSG